MKLLLGILIGIGLTVVIGSLAEVFLYVPAQRDFFSFRTSFAYPVITVGMNWYCGDFEKTHWEFSSVYTTFAGGILAKTKIACHPDLKKEDIIRYNYSYDSHN